MRQALARSRVSRAHLTNTTTITTANKTQHNYYYYYLELERQKSFTFMLIDLSRRVIVLIPQSRFNTHHHHHLNKKKNKRLSTKWTTIIKEGENKQTNKTIMRNVNRLRKKTITTSSSNNNNNKCLSNVSVFRF